MGPTYHRSIYGGAQDVMISGGLKMVVLVPGEDHW